MVKPNQDIRDYMADHCITQKDLAAEVGVSQCMISKQDNQIYFK
jgi:predicted transcriptional regulator